MTLSRRDISPSVRDHIGEADPIQGAIPRLLRPRWGGGSYTPPPVGGPLTLPSHFFKILGLAGTRSGGGV